MTDVNQMRAGMRVRVAKLESTVGMLINPAALLRRKAGQTGTVLDWVPGHGGDVWWVTHDAADAGDGLISAYCFTELEAI